MYDKTITSICLHNFCWESVKEDEVRSVFSEFGDIKSIVIVKEEQIAFVNYLLRSAADSAVDKYLEDGIEINNCNMTVGWAYGKPKGPIQDFSSERVSVCAEKPQEEPPSAVYKKPKLNLLPPGSAAIKYSSMDPSQLGSVIRKQ